MIASVVYSQDLAPLVKEMGGTMCRFLVARSQLHRKSTCPETKCGFDEWSDALAQAVAKKDTQHQRVILSFSHNGFGNQLWEHTFAFMIAVSMKAKLMIGMIPDYLSFDGVTPPNTFAGMHAMTRLLPDNVQYDRLPLDHPTRQLCDNETFFISDRPRDWRDRNYATSFKSNMHSILTDKNPRCLKFIGYFQNYPMCHGDSRNLWTPKMFGNYTQHPGPNDLSIYLRCVPRHYFFNDKHFYDAILNGTSFEQVWLFTAPECPSKLGKDPKYDGQVASVFRLLYDKYGAKRYVAAYDDKYASV
jgi:hypothetical protein